MFRHRSAILRFRLSSIALALGAGLTARLAAAQDDAAERSAAVLVAPRLAEHVDPVYPKAALERGREVDLVLVVVIDAAGRVEETAVAESGGAEFDAAAISAVKRWRFEPATRDGRPVAARIRVPFHFAPGPHEASAAHASHARPRHRRGAASAAPPEDFHGGVLTPHSVLEEDRPPEVHVQGRQLAPSRGASDYRIDRRTLATAPHATAADLLRTAPGVHVTRPEGEAIAHRLYLRGFDAEHGQDVELRVGAIPLNQRSHVHGQGYADLGVVIPETVRSLRVLEGVYDVEQGDFAVAGTAWFDLGVEERGTHAEASYGSFDTRRALVVWAPRGEAEETFAAFTARQSDGFGDGMRGSTSGTAVSQYRLDLPGHTSLLVHGAAHAARAGIAGVLRRDDIDAGRVGFYDAYPDPTARSQSAASSRAQIGLGLDHSADDGGRLGVDVWVTRTGYRSRINYTGYVERSRENPAWMGRGDLVEQSNDDLGLGVRASHRGARTELGKGFAGVVTTGTEIGSNAIEQSQALVQAPQNETWDRRVDASVRATSVGFWGDATLHTPARLRAHAGLRADFLLFDVDDRLGNFTPSFQQRDHLLGHRRTAAGATFGPRTGVEWYPWSWVTLTASYGHGHRSPQARQLDEGEQAPFATVRSYDVGARFRDSDRFGLAVAAYETRLSSDLAFDAGEGALERIGPTTRRGLVAHLTASPTRELHSAVSATWVNATLDDPPPATPSNPSPAFAEGQALPFVPPLVVRTDLGWTGDVGHLAGAPLRLVTGGGTTFLSPRPLPHDRRAQAVHLLDLRAGVRRRELELRLDVTNVLDHRYAEEEQSFASDWQTEPIPSALPARHVVAGPPRSITLTLGVHL